MSSEQQSAFTECYISKNTLHYFPQISKNSQNSFLFTLTKLEIYHCDVTISYITHLHINLAILMVAQNGLGLYYLKLMVNFSQDRRIVEFVYSNFVNRSKFDDMMSSNYRNNTNIALSLLFVNNIFLYLLLFSVLFFRKVMFLRQFLVLI